ncbi:hypothetical protein TRFO_05359 [Tritrichomonas foetus]|uniref:Uncharacterized protein n=1 Tax=Tritrichomonas foetus TaxID=1144522 RepID=A0A1J4K6M4_9EUKA|nr:hypothetical protein TRFO_05359 [Tritrichomonas foetus]|eukprot:OHT07121.1 hypothetical protein TRFO_05359 [Tritrichomonas foetus]
MNKINFLNTEPKYSFTVFSINFIYVYRNYTNPTFCGHPIIFIENNDNSEESLFSEIETISSSSSPTKLTTESQTKSQDEYITYSKSLSLTKSFILTFEKTISITFENSFFHQISDIEQESITYSYHEDEEYQNSTTIKSYSQTYILSKTHSIRRLIIFIETYSILISEIVIFTEIEIKKLSAELLIGIICGSFSIIFVFISLIVFLIRRTHQTSTFDSMSESLSFEEITLKKNKSITEINPSISSERLTETWI